MLRSVAIFAALASATAADTATCALNGARAVDDLLDSATYIWASVQRCQKPGAGSSGNAILCSLDVSSAIEATNAMINVILKGVEQCGHLDGQTNKCGMQIGVLTKAFAGLAASSSGVAAKCPNKLNGGQALQYLVKQPTIGSGQSALASAAQQASFAQCLVDVKDITKSIFKATKRIISVKDNCDGENPRHCAHNSLKIVAAFASMGEYLGGAIGRCSANNAQNTKLRADGQCAEEADALLRHVANTARAGMYMQKYCEIGAERLYELDNEIEPANGSSLTMGLAALLPLTAVLAFAGGSRLGKSRNQPVLVEVTEDEP